MTSRSEALRANVARLEAAVRLDEAAELLRAAPAADMDAAATIDLVRIEDARGRADARDEALERALASFPDSADVLVAKADRELHRGAVDEAATFARRATEVAPTDGVAAGKLGSLLVWQGRCAEAIEVLDRARRLAPHVSWIHSALLLALHYVPAERDAVFSEHVAWGDKFGWSRELLQKKDLAKRPDVLRVAYLSADFRDHAVARFVLPLVRAHDRSRIAVHLYGDVASPDGMTRELAAAADVYRDVARRSSFEIARVIAADDVDVLIELGGHTKDSRLDVLAARPCPLQLTYLGYPDTTGMREVDFRVTDRWADPDGEEAFHVERLLRTPVSAWCYGGAPPERDEPARSTERPLRFVAYHALAKISDELFDAWAQLLARVPGSTLETSSRASDASSARARWDRSLEARGVDPTRVVCRSWRNDAREHLRAYESADIALDAFPYAGTTTTCDALCHGVPVVTLAGDRHAGRVGKSLLSAVGLDDLVAASVESYVDIAARLASDEPRRRALRTELPARFRATLGNAATFTKAFESSLDEAWDRLARESPPRASLRRVALDPKSTVYVPATLEHPACFAWAEQPGLPRSTVRSMIDLLRVDEGDVVVTIGDDPLMTTALWASANMRVFRYEGDPALSSALRRTAERTAGRLVIGSGPDDAASPCILVLCGPPSDAAWRMVRSVLGRARAVVVDVASPEPPWTPWAQVLPGRRWFRHQPGVGRLEPIGHALDPSVDRICALTDSETSRLTSSGAILDARPTTSEATPDRVTPPWLAGLFRATRPEGPELPASMRWYLEGMDAALDADRRASALHRAIARALEEQTEDPFTRFTVARTATAVGADSIAVDVLTELLEASVWKGRAPVRGFLPALSRYDRLEPENGDWAPWALAQAIEAVVKLSAPSSYFHPPPVAVLLRRFQTLPYPDPEMARRLGLFTSRARGDSA